jgi:branched-chain amino acid transport system ATP-binding protein
MAAILEIKNVEVVYDRAILVLKGISLVVPEAGIVALLGPNGAGKSTTLKAISGLLQAEEGEVSDGEIRFLGRRIDRERPEEIVRAGIFQVMEGRRVVEDLTVDENLLMGAYTRRDRTDIRRDHERVFDYFPQLARRRRGLMARPRLMLLDEPSLGLAPLLVREIFAIIQKINQEERTAILLVEQNANLALSIAAAGYIMENGRIVLEGEAGKLRANEDVKHFYLGGVTGDGGRKTYRDFKFYKRRKRWLS